MNEKVYTMIRCNHCMNEFSEELVDAITKREKKEKCPFCGEDDALMDLGHSRYELVVAQGYSDFLNQPECDDWEADQFNGREKYDVRRVGE